ncbi:MAG: hypothetical protein ACHQIM_18895 [Sphingobacteriales bacterium]
MQLKDNKRYIIAATLLIIAAFVQCYKTVHDLHWAYEPDFDRDIAYIRGMLDGHYGKDPNMAGQYMWYNPMLFWFETGVVKITGLPINVAVARAGAFLNLINPIVFFIVLVRLFDAKVALAALLSFLFLVSGNLPCWGAATYSPWLISDTFSQFLFYISIFFCYKAFSEQTLLWFIILGASLGIAFLGHSAPVFIIILIMILIQGEKVIRALFAKQYSLVGTYFLQGFITIIPFIIFAFPFLYYVYGKYHLHFINRIILQCAPGIFARKETFTLLKLNVTFSLLISIAGMVWFYRKFENPVLKKIIWSWFFVTLVMYVYESIVPTADKIFHINLPDTIPAFHYFFYLKALQSVFFGFGFLFLFNLLIHKIEVVRKTAFTPGFSGTLLMLSILLYMLVYYPIYSNRVDFSVLRQQAIEKGKEKDKIEVYDFISKNIPLDNVMLCSHGLSLFPVMPTGIKMVSIETYFSNPYVSYDQRESDRVEMLSYLTTGEPASAQQLFSAYKVSNVLLTNGDFAKYKKPSFTNSNVIFKNSSYTILSFTGNSGPISNRM